MKRVAVYCGSKPGVRPAYAAAAEELGALLARSGLGLVYGGGAAGLMGAVANAALRHGGEVIGVIPRRMVIKEVVHEGLTELRIVEDMHERKALMAGLADAFIALPGGYGTYEEFFEILTWAQLGWHAKPLALLNADGFYTPLLTFLDHANAEGFVRLPPREALVVADTPAAVIARLRQSCLPPHEHQKPSSPET
jgi:uncharacterized protein (TIGR00730 family)